MALIRHIIIVLQSDIFVMAAVRPPVSQHDNYYSKYLENSLG